MEKMMNFVKWNFGRIISPIKATIEISDVINGPFTELITLGSEITEHEHTSGTNDTYYRFIIYFQEDILNEGMIFDAGNSKIVEKGMIIEETLTVTKDEVLALEGLDYSVDYTTGTITRIVTGIIDENDVVLVSFGYESFTAPTFPKRVVEPPMCKVYGYMYSVKGLPVYNETLYIRTYRPPQSYNEAVIDDMIIEVSTGMDGYFEINLIRNSVIKLSCLRAKIDVTLTIPNVDAKSFNVLLEEN